MKKRILLLFVLLVIPFSVKAESLTYNEAISAVKQSMQAWYMRGAYRQYNSSKNTYSILRHPEDATIQDMGYSVCSGFTNDVWMEAFGLKAQNDGIGGNTPAGSKAYCKEARSYLDSYNCVTNKSNISGCQGEYLVYYKNTKDNKTYFYNPKGWTTDKLEKLENFLTLLQPGDIISYDGHVAILYDFKYNSSGKRVDALLLESKGGSYHVKTKIDPDETPLHRLFYYKVKSADSNGLMDLTTANSYMPYEGTVHWTWLSNYSVFVKEGTITCKKEMCSITRAFSKGANGEANLNYNIEWPQQINTSKARNELPGIFIQKTSSKYDNNSVHLGDTITYTVRIQNNSDMIKVKGTNQKKNYSTFHVTETLPKEVDFVASTVDNTLEGTYDSNSRTIIWNISSLKAGETILLKYKVKVKDDTNNLDKQFKATGKLYASKAANYIPTGVVALEIIRSTEKKAEDYLNCYNKQKKDGDTYLALIQNTYECVYGKNLGFNLKKFALTGDNMLEQLINRPYKNPGNNKEGAIQLDTSGDNKVYADMILNNYWGGLVRTNAGLDDPTQSYYIFPRWRKNSSGNYIGDINRAKTISSGHFKAGDVLIYYMDKANTKSSLRFTNENGLYAFIYLDGCFVGLNHVGVGAERTTFSKGYYTHNKLSLEKNLYTGSATHYDYANYQTLFGKDSYVILRPEKVITEIESIKVKTNPTKTEYYQNQTLDITGGVITTINNDGTTQDIPMNNSSVKISGYDASKLGEQKISVTYKGKSTSFKVTVNKTTISSISVKTNPTKTNYFVGEKLDLTGGVIKVTYSDNSTKTYSMKNSGVKVTGFDSSKSGASTLTVTYGGKTTTFTVQIDAVEVSNILVGKYPNKIVYQQGEELDLTGGTIIKKYNNATTQNIPMTDPTISVSGYDKNLVGVQSITLSIEDKTISLEIIVNQNSGEGETLTLDSILIYNSPDKLNYHIGEELDLTGGKIKAKYLSGSSNVIWKTIDMTNNDVTASGFSSTEEGEKTITISYSDKTATFGVMVSKVEPKIKKIEVTKKPRKKKYIRYQEELDATGGEVTVTYSDNTTEIVDLNSDEVSLLDFDNSTVGEHQVYVIYKGLETTFPITIFELGDEMDEDDPDGPIQNVTIKHEPEKINYLQGVDAFNVSGIVLRVIFEDGEVRDIELADCPGEYTISGFDNTKVGEQEVTIDYHGHKVSFKVNVQSDDLYVAIPNTSARRSLLLTITSILLIMIGLGIITRTRKSIRSI